MSAELSQFGSGIGIAVSYEESGDRIPDDREHLPQGYQQ